jgi:hypothetical protein
VKAKNSATNETSILIHWKDMVWHAVRSHWAVDGVWFRSERVNAYLCRAYDAGEPVWMAAEAVMQMWKGELRAAAESRCTIGSAMAACRRVAS